MYAPIECIALRSVRGSDSKLLLSAWTRTAGRVTFAMPAGASREARRRRAITAPLQTFAGVCDIREGRDVQSIREVVPVGVSGVMERTPSKAMTAIFLGEALDLLLRRADAEAALSDFLFGSVEAFDALADARAVANFHLIFLYRLAHFMGIEPQLDTEGPVFDMRESRFRATEPLHQDYVNGDEAAVVRILDRANYRSGSALPFGREGRRKVLDGILKYYALHLASLSSLKSLAILREF